MKLLAIIFSTALFLGIAACSEQESETAKQPPQAPSETKPAAPAAETKTTTPKPAAQTTVPKTQPAAATAEDTKKVTNQACRVAVSKETQEKDVVVLSNEFSEANTLVIIGVGPNRAPWKCLVSNRGKVEDISFTGNDGDGVEQPAKAAAPKHNASAEDIKKVTNQACRVAVSKETQEKDVVVLSNEFSEANTLVMIGVGPSRAPWKCLVSNRGKVAEISFTGDEGKL